MNVQQSRIEENKMPGYAWVILFVTTLGVLSSLGFGRFSFGAVLPFMKDGLALNYRETGIVASSVFLGYLLSAMVSGHFVNRFTHKKVIVFFQFMIGVGMFLSAVATGFWSALAACFLIGLGAGGAYVPSLGLLGEWFTPEKKGMATGTAMAGSGIGIVFSGIVVPWIVSIQVDTGWRLSWHVLAWAVIIIAILHLVFLKNPPSRKRVLNLNDGQDSNTPTESPAAKEDSVYRNKMIWAVGLIYSTWGFSYIIFSTFIVDYLMLDAGMDEVRAGQFFAVAGLVSIISGSLWGTISDKFGRIFTLILVYFFQTVLLIGFGLSQHSTLLLLEIILYASSLWAVPSIMMAGAGDFTSPKNVAIAMGFITLFFGIGQFISPIVTGFIVDMTHSYSSAFYLSAFICGIGGTGSYLLYRRLSRASGVSA
ncbi:MAG: MFS transporter [Bacillaceae bacterium]|nr:MFS transporter [Bacillaceae bacterium]